MGSNDCTTGRLLLDESYGDSGGGGPNTSMTRSGTGAELAALVNGRQTSSKACGQATFNCNTRPRRAARVEILRARVQNPTENGVNTDELRRGSEDLTDFALERVTFRQSHFGS